MRQAHEAVRSQQSGKLSMMASTITSVLLCDGDAIVCNLGDSRTFLVRGGELRRLTRDHTVLAEMEEAGFDTNNPFAAMHRNSLTGAVGMDASVDPDCQRVPMQPGDVLVLCSDGLYEPVPPERMVPLLAQGGSAQEMAERLVAEAYNRGGTDNITGVVVRVLEADKPGRELHGRLEADDDRLGGRRAALLREAVERHQHVGLGEVGGRAPARNVVRHHHEASAPRAASPSKWLVRSTTCPASTPSSFMSSAFSITTRRPLRMPR